VTAVSARGRRPARRRSRLAALVALGCALAAGEAGAAGDGGTAALAACIRDPRCHRTAVAAHRGLAAQAPGNSREALAAAVAAGVPVVEVDLRRSSDGEMFLFHDQRLDAPALAGRRVEDLPAAALAAVRLRNGEALPRLDEALAVTRGRALLVLDLKSDALLVELAADWLAARGALDDALLFLNTHEEMIAAARARQRHPRLLLMVRLLDTRITVDNTRALMGALPAVLHTDRVGPGEVARLHGLGVKVWMNAIELEKYLPPFRAIALGWMLRARPDFVLSMDPVDMMRRVGGR
jgi:glycerophosphoryl diester phosphodiesterase